MKKGFTTVLAFVMIIGLATGGFLLYKTSTPEYMLAQTIADVKECGLAGLKEHLTGNARNIVENAEGKAEKAAAAGSFSTIIQAKALSFIKEHMAEVSWTVNDVLKGKTQTDVIVGFNYRDSIIGTVSIIMIKEGREWKINGIGFPDFDQLSLW